MSFKMFKELSIYGLIFGSSIFAQEINFTGSFTSQVGIGLPHTHENKGDFLLGQNIFDGTIKSYIDEATVVVNAQLVHDALGSQSANGYSALISDDGSFALKLKEVYIDWKGEMLALRVGRQIVSWGKADDIQITDVICPKDEASFVASDYNESRLGIDAVRLSLLTEKIQADVYYIPFFTPSILPLAKGNPLKAKVFPANVDGIRIYAPEDYRDLEHPSKHVSNSEFAFRASAYTSFADMSLYYFYGWDDTPFFKYNPHMVIYNSADSKDNSSIYDDIFEIDISGKYKRMMMIGLDAAIPVGEFVIRLEEAYFPKRHFQTTAEYQMQRQFSGKNVKSSLQKHQLISLAGLDWTPSGGWTITAQYVADIVFDHDKAIDRKNFEHQATLSIEKSVLNETLTLMASGALDLRAFSSAAELEIDYKLNDAITLSAIGDLYYGGTDRKKGLFGEYRNLSSITFKGKISF
ncbi:DUF1302 family protein [Fibrobacter sp. UBA4297]|uniref:DUF1302 family protein n=1 Tax=Fibrobacter sp. UBA4297 TaxID=1946536 RepID=UPI0025B82838|nr:DUF1302 family protein [Fibrobacter sp. UBA4297]